MQPTLTKLNQLLSDEDLPTPQLTKAHCETYGKRTFAYIRCHHMVQRARIEETLTAAGVYINPRYCRRAGNCPEEAPIIEARVSYLRAKGWNE